MNIVEILAYIILSLIFVIVLCGVFMIIKNFNTLRQHEKIDNAIYEYRRNCIRKKVAPAVNYDDEEDYDETLFRIWDWGYKNILPSEKYEIIKEFIKINHSTVERKKEDYE